MEAKSKEINGHTYTVTPFPGRRAFKVKAKLLKKLGPGLASMLGAAKGDSLIDTDIDGAALGKGVETLFANLGSPEEMMQLVEELLAMTRRDGKEITPAVIDLEYQGNLSEMYRGLAFVLEVNFADFFGEGGIGGLGDLIKTKMSSLGSESSADSIQASPKSSPSGN